MNFYKSNLYIEVCCDNALYSCIINYKILTRQNNLCLVKETESYYYQIDRYMRICRKCKIKLGVNPLEDY